MHDIISVYTVADWTPYDSYGLVACRLAEQLARRGARVNAVSLGRTVAPGQSAEVRAIVEQPIMAALGGICMGWPTHFEKMSGLLHAGPKIAITMFESSTLPAGWADILNEFDAVVTPCKFCGDLFARCGVKVPVHVIPLGINPLYQYVPRHLEYTAQEPLTFLAFADRGERKGGEVALQSFLRAFGQDPRYRFILKHREVSQKYIFTNPNIKAVQQDMSEAELYELYQQCDVLVNPHKGEGFGLIPREFAASGGLALTTAWSGTADDLDQWGVGIPYTLEPALWTGNQVLEGQAVGKWAKVDPAHLAMVLRKVAAVWSHYAPLCKQYAQAARDLYSWDRFGEQVLALWKEVMNVHVAA